MPLATNVAVGGRGEVFSPREFRAFCSGEGVLRSFAKAEQRGSHVSEISERKRKALVREEGRRGVSSPLSLARRRRAAERRENRASIATAASTGLRPATPNFGEAPRGAAAFELREKVELEHSPECDCKIADVNGRQYNFRYGERY